MITCNRVVVGEIIRSVLIWDVFLDSKMTRFYDGLGVRNKEINT